MSEVDISAEAVAYLAEQLCKWSVRLDRMGYDAPTSDLDEAAALLEAQQAELARFKTWAAAQQAEIERLERELKRQKSVNHAAFCEGRAQGQLGKWYEGRQASWGLR